LTLVVVVLWKHGMPNTNKTGPAANGTLANDDNYGIIKDLCDT